MHVVECCLYTIFLTNGILRHFWCSSLTYARANSNTPSNTLRFLDVRFLDVRFLFLSLLPMPPLKREYNAVSAIARWNLAMSYWWKPHDIWQRSRHYRGRPIANSFKSEKLQILTAKHRRSLRVGGNWVRSDARSEFEILEPSPKGGWSCKRLEEEEKTVG